MRALEIVMRGVPRHALRRRAASACSGRTRAVLTTLVVAVFASSARAGGAPTTALNAGDGAPRLLGALLPAEFVGHAPGDDDASVRASRGASVPRSGLAPAFSRADATSSSPRVVSDCASIHSDATGNLSDATGPGCVLPPNVTATLPSGTVIVGDGSLTLSPGAVLHCARPGCALTVALGPAATLTLRPDARLHAGFLNITAGVVAVVGPGARVDADQAGDPDETRGWTGVGGAGYGGEGAACPIDGAAVPARPGGPGYAYDEFIRVGVGSVGGPGGDGTSAPPAPASGTAAGGAGGGRVVVMCGALEFQDGGVISAAGGKPNADARAPGGGSGGTVVVYAGSVDARARRTPSAGEPGYDLSVGLGGGGGGGGGASGAILAGGGDGGDDHDGGGGGGGGRIALLSPETWPPSVTVAAGGGRSGGACGTAGFHGAAGTVFNVASGALSVSNLDVTPDDANVPVRLRTSPAPPACLAPGSWGACATTRLEGALPLRGVASLRIADAAVACTDACPRPNANEDAATFGRGLLGGADSSGMGGAAVHLEASDAITITGSSHLLHGGGVGVGFRAGAGAGAEALWLVSPEVTVTDKSTLRVFGSLSVDGGPVGGGSFAVEGGSAVAVDPSPASATSFVFNVETVRISGGGSLVVSSDGALAVAGRGEDRGSLVVGDEDDPARESVLRGAFLDAAGGNDASSIRAGRLVVDRFARVSVTRNGVVRASLEGDGDAGRDARVQCSALSCPAYVFGPGTRTAMGLASNLAIETSSSRSRSSRIAEHEQRLVERLRAFQTFGVPTDGEVEAPEQTAAPSPPVPCQIGVSTPFSLQLCHASTVEVTAGGVVASRATHAYAVDLVRVTGAGSSLDADGAGCRAGEGEGRGVGFASGAGGGGGYGGVGGDGFTPDRGFAPNRTEDAPSGTNGTVSRGGSTYGDGAAPCAVSGAGSGGGAGAGAGYGGAGGGLVVLGTATRPLAGLIVGAGARVSADGADGGDTDVDGADRDVAGGGGGGSGGTVLAFTRALDVDPTGRVAAAGGAGGASGGGGGGGGRVHLAWPERLPDVSVGASNNRTAPDGTLAAIGGASRGLGRPGGDGSVSSSPCPPGYSGALCHRCVAGTYKSERGVGACVPCAPPPRRAAFVDPPGPAGAVAPECPYACARENLRPSDCATRFEAAVAAVGGPASAAALVATTAVVVASAAAATARHTRNANRRGGTAGSRRRRFGARGASRRRGGEYANHANDITAPFLLSLADADADSDDDGADDDARDVAASFVHRVYFHGANDGGDPWRLPRAPPPAVRPLLHAEEWNRLVRACASGAPASWGGVDGRGGSGDGRGGSRGAGRKGSYEGATRARWRGVVGAALETLCPPAANAWRWRERRRVAKNLARLVDHYDRRCLRSARARALQEGLAFGASEDRTVAWLDFFAQGDEEEGAAPEFSGEDPLAGRLPMPVLFAGEGTFESPWRWERADRDLAGEGLLLALLRLATTGDALDGVLRRARAKLRVCRLVDPKRFRESGTSRRGRSDARGRCDARTLGRGGRAHRVGGADAAFTFALTPGEPNSPRREPNASRSRPSRITASNDDDDDDLLAIRSTARDVFAAVEGAENLSRFLSDEANPTLFRHGVALTLAAFFPPADDPFGGFRLGVVVHRPDDAPSTPALPPSTPQTAFDLRSPRARLRFGGDSDDDENQPGAEPDEGNDAGGYGASPSDAERGDGDAPCESGGESSVVGSLEEKAFRGAAAWAVAAATRGRAGVSGVRGRGARDDENGGDRFTSLRSLASPMTERAGPGPGSTTRLDSTRVVSRASASPRTSKMAWPPPLDASDSLDGSRARARAREPESASPASTPRSAAANRAREDERRQRAKTRALLARVPLGTVLLHDPPRASDAARSASRTSRRFSETLARAFALRNVPPTSGGGGTRARLAALSVALVVCDVLASFAVLAQTFACDAARALPALLAPPLAVPAAPVAGAVAALFAFGAFGAKGERTRDPDVSGGAGRRDAEFFADAADAARGYARWTRASLTGVAVAAAVGASARMGLAPRCMGPDADAAFAADGEWWFVAPAAAAAAKLLASRVACVRAANLEEAAEEARRWEDETT